MADEPIPRVIKLVNSATSACTPNVPIHTCRYLEEYLELSLFLSLIFKQILMNNRVTKMYINAKKILTVMSIFGSTAIKPIIILRMIIIFNKFGLAGKSCGPLEKRRIFRNIFKLNIILVL